MRLSDLDYDLPDDLIACVPADRRDHARLMLARPPHLAVRHHIVSDLPQFFQSGDLIIINDTRVIPARIFGRRASTNGKIEGLFIETRDDEHWQIMLKSGGKLQPNDIIHFDIPNDSEQHSLQLIEKNNEGIWLAQKHSPLNTESLLNQIGAMPLPPYILAKRKLDHADLDDLDRQRYQTVYANAPGAVAAPTAGLHFTDDLLQRVTDAGATIRPVTLHVGLGTFAPVRVDDLNDHSMHTERFTIPSETLSAIKQARTEGRRIIAVGTTSVRALESLPDQFDTSTDYHAETDILIHPPFRFRYIDGLMTNFHLPKSTLLALVAALTGLDQLMHYYQIAVNEKYRFFSYGDSMLLLPEKPNP